MNTTAIYGGSFDPIHNGHIDIIKNLSKKFDRVIVLPSAISPFKQDASAAPLSLRLQMLNESLKLDNVEVSSFEAENGGVSYSYISAEHFHNCYPNDKLYFVIGSEMLKKLHKWEKIEHLSQLVTFFVIQRPHFIIKPSILKRLNRLGINVEVSDITGKDISSSSVKVDIAFGKYDSLFGKVKKIIKDNNLYCEFDSFIDAFKGFNLSDERISHTYHAIQEGIKLAKIYDANVKDVITALFLHDLAKGEFDNSYFSPAQLESLYDVPADVAHAFKGAYIAKNLFKTKKSIQNAIQFHCTARAKMSKLEKIVYLADYTEPTRSFEGVDMVRSLCSTNLNLAMLKALENTISHLNEKNGDIYYLTLEACEFFKRYDKKESANDIKSDSLKGTVQNIQKTVQISHDKKRRTNPEQGAYDLAYTIAQLIDDKKGKDITLVNLNGKTIIADYFVIASATSTTAVKAYIDHVDEKLSKDFHIEPLRRDIDSKWSAIDYGSVILHVFLEETRKFYDIERLWSDGTNIERF